MKRKQGSRQADSPLRRTKEAPPSRRRTAAPVSHAQDRTRSAETARAPVSEWKHLTAVARDMQSPVIFTDARRRIVWVNPAFTRVTGYTPEEAMDRSPAFLQGPLTDPEAVQRMREALNRGEGFRQTVLNYHKQGHTYWLDLEVQPMLGRRGALTGFFSIQRVVTREVELLRTAEAKTRQLIGFFTNSPDLLCIADLEGHFVRLNPRWEELLGHPSAEMTGKPFTDFVHPEDCAQSLRALQQLRAGGRVENFTNRYRMRDGGYRWIEWCARVEQGFIHAMARDVTERRELERELQRANELLERTNEAARVGGWEVDCLTGRVWWSRVTREIHEVGADFVPDVAAGIQFYEPGWSRDEIAHVFGRLREEGVPFDCELLIRTAKGKLRWVRVTGYAEWAEGRPVRLYGAFQDIHEKKESELRLRQSERKFSLAFQTSPHGVCLLDAETGECQESNAAYQALFGFAPEELRGRRLDGLEITPDEGFVRGLVHDLRAGQSVVAREFELRRNDGTWFEALVSAGLLQLEGRQAMMLIVQDVSQLKRRDRLLAVAAVIAEVFLRPGDEQELVQQMLAHLGEGCGQDRAYLFEMHTATDGRMLLSQRYEWAREGIRAEIGKLDLQNMDLAAHLPTFCRALFDNATVSGGPGDFQGEERQIVESQDIVSLVVVPVYVDGKPWGLLGMDNCRRAIEWSEGETAVLRTIATMLGSYLSQQHLQIESRRLHQAIEQCQDSVLITDATGTIVYVNQGFERVSGYSRAEVLGGNPRILKSGQHDASFYREMWSELLAGRVWQGRLVNRRKDGSFRHEFAIISPIKNDRGAITHFVAVKHDMTQELEQERRLLQSQKLESVGRLAGGVAHDFNNMLAVIQLNAEVALVSGAMPRELREHLENIRSAAERSAGITRQLLTFARQQSGEPQRLDVNASITALMRMLRRLIPEEVELAFDPAADVPLVLLDPGQFDQIVVNLVVNAKDALDGKGRIHLATSLCRVEPGAKGTRSQLRPGEYACVTVTDNGSGMDAGVMSRIMDPFFTTKEVGRGTGLGLSIVYSVVQQAGGDIEVQSELGKGSLFRVLLPACAPAAPAAAVSATAPAADPAPLEATILLVEDEPNILLVTRKVLERMGCRVIATEDPGKALEWARLHPGRIDLLLSDVIMPGMDGSELAARITETHPGLRCLWMSGYTSDLMAQRQIGLDGRNFLPKPFSADQLATAVRRALEGAPPASAAAPVSGEP